MKILTVDTSHSVASCAICEDGKIIDFAKKDTDLSHSCWVLPMCQEILDKNNLALADIDVFAAVSGPGSFTGIRIGVAAVKGFCFALDRPMIGVCALEAVAIASSHTGLVCSLIKARADEYFYCLYQAEGGRAEKLRPEGVGTLLEIQNELSGHSDIHYEQGLPEGKYAGLVAYNMYQEGKAGTYHNQNPVYLRQSQAERMRNNTEK